jgi:hypothetical protein
LIWVEEASLLSSQPFRDSTCAVLHPRGNDEDFMLLEVARYGKEAMPDLSLQRLNDPMDVREKFEVLFRRRSLIVLGSIIQ